MSKNPTQTDVARYAQVSTATVSRVLNGSPLVRADVRERVEAAIAALAYVPHEQARALVMRRTRTLGAIIPTLNNAIFAEGINALEQAARLRGYTLMISVSNYDLEGEVMLVRKMVERGVDGLMLVGNQHAPEAFALLRNSGVRFVNGWTHDPALRMANVGFSNREAMFPVVDHLVASGHRNIGMLAGLCTMNDRARDRLIGVKERLAHHGLALLPKKVAEVPYSVEHARAALKPVLKTDITALICGNDVIAFGAVFEALALGLSVPGDLAITGFDNLALARELSPAITTVDVPTERMGECIANSLIDAVEREEEVVSRRLPTKLIVRASTSIQGLGPS